MRLSYIRSIILVLALLATKVAISQQREIEALEALGLENIEVVVDENNCYVSFDDRVYRGVARGVEAVLESLSAIDSTKVIHLLVQRNGIAQLSVVAPPGDSELTVSYDTDSLKEQFDGIERVNRSFGKVDLVLYPELFLENSWFDKLYGVAVNISPAAEVSLWRGAKMTAQVVIPIYTNMQDEKQYIRPGVIALRQDIRLHNRLYGSVSVGNFTDDRMGVDATLNYYNPSGRWNIGARAGLTGSSTFYGGEWVVSTWRRFTWSGWASYYLPIYQLELTGRVMQMVYGDRGVYGSARRYFNNVSIGLYAMYTAGVANGGFTFSVALPGQRRGKRSGAIRATYPEYFTRVYRAKNGVNTLTGFDYETSPTAGSMQDFYNPDYIKNQLLKR